MGTAIDTADGALAIRLVANHAHHHGYGGTGAVADIEVPASQVLDLPNANEEPDYPRVVIAAAWHAWIRGDTERAAELRRQALEADSRYPTSTGRPRVELDAHNLTAMVSLAGGDYAGAVASYGRVAELASAEGYPGLAAINLAVGVNTSLLGGVDAEDLIAKAELAVKLARQSGMHGAIVISINSLALTLVERDPARARALLEESVERSANPGEASPSGVLTAGLVAGRLQDWDLTLKLAAQSMQMERWIMAPLQVAPCLALCARALAESRPEVAGVLHSAAYTTFRRAASEAGDQARSGTAPVGPNANFMLTAMHETGDIVAEALGNERSRALREEGAAMSMDEAITFALANIDPKLLTGPIASIER